MSRRAWGVVLLTATVPGTVALAAAGCGAEQTAASSAAAGAAAMGPALLSPREVPAGFYPADPQRAFRGIRPADPDCARLLRLADAVAVRGTRGAPHGHAAFFRAEPPATLVQHVYRLPKGRAAALLADARAAAAGCPVITMEVGDDREGRLYRARLRPPGGAGEAVAVRYAGKGRRQAGLDVVVARVGDDLVTVAAPGEFARGGAETIEAAEQGAVRKLRAARDKIGEVRAEE
ncbi:hypothetical protein ACIBF1_12420 [Spirillospora sp. NPDC050679]